MRVRRFGCLSSGMFPEISVVLGNESLQTVKLSLHDYNVCSRERVHCTCTCMYLSVAHLGGES